MCAQDCTLVFPHNGTKDTTYQITGSGERSEVGMSMPVIDTWVTPVTVSGTPPAANAALTRSDSA